MAKPPTALGAWEGVVREWGAGFCGFRGGARSDGDKGQGVTVGMVVSGHIEGEGLRNQGVLSPWVC